LPLYTADTHALVWHLTRSPLLSKRVRECFREAEQGTASIIIPTIVLAELLFIIEKKKLPLRFEELLDTLFTSLNYTVYPFDFQVLANLSKLSALPELHDRIIVATALVTGSSLLTKDRSIIEAEIVRSIW
jgi:PIN domain nuclease of toxin-antitoxin system